MDALEDAKLFFVVGRSYYTLEEGMKYTTLEEVSIPSLQEPHQPQWMSPPGVALDILPRRGKQTALVAVPT